MVEDHTAICWVQQRWRKRRAEKCWKGCIGMLKADVHGNDLCAPRLSHHRLARETCRFEQQQNLPHGVAAQISCMFSLNPHMLDERAESRLMPGQLNGG